MVLELVNTTSCYSIFNCKRTILYRIQINCQRYKDNLQQPFFACLSICIYYYIIKQKCALYLAEIECLSPEIPHGSTNLNIVYKENDILHYSCKEGYKTNNPSKCTRNGWTVQPRCEGGTTVFDFLIV